MPMRCIAHLLSLRTASTPRIMPPHTKRRFTFLLSCLSCISWTLLPLSRARAENWPQFRGPTGLGYTSERDLPLTWNAKTGENIAWKAPLPKSNSAYASPVVWGDRVFVTAVQNEPLEQRVLCFAKADGKKLWETPVEPGPLILKDLRGGYNAPTPCTDGKRVYVVFGSAVIAALDFDGKVIWRKEIANHAFDVALGSSPILYGDTVILDCDQTGKTSTITAWKTADGEIKWEAKRPETTFAHTTPVVVTVAGKPQMLVSATGALQGLDPATGQYSLVVLGAGRRFLAGLWRRTGLQR